MFCAFFKETHPPHSRALPNMADNLPKGSIQCLCMMKTVKSYTTYVDLMKVLWKST